MKDKVILFLENLRKPIKGYKNIDVKSSLKK
jgi:hypothetical protein